MPRQLLHNKEKQSAVVTRAVIDVDNLDNICRQHREHLRPAHNVTQHDM